MECDTCERPIQDGEPIFRFRYVVKPEKVSTPFGTMPIRDWYGSAVGIDCKRCHVKAHKRGRGGNEFEIRNDPGRYRLFGLDENELEQHIQQIISDPFNEKWLTKRQCEVCGREIWDHPTLRHQPRVYNLCSEQCRKRLRAIKKRVNPMTATCRVCGELFYPKRRDAKTCGPTCRQRLRRARSAP